MPKPSLLIDAKRLLRAVRKSGFADRRMSLSTRLDGTLTLEVAAPSPLELSKDLSRDIDDIVENEWDKVHDKPTA